VLAIFATPICGLRPGRKPSPATGRVVDDAHLLSIDQVAALDRNSPRWKSNRSASWSWPPCPICKG
jgi:hypothetical protein